MWIVSKGQRSKFGVTRVKLSEGLKPFTIVDLPQNNSTQYKSCQEKQYSIDKELHFDCTSMSSFV